jgi:hypothetical protein
VPDSSSTGTDLIIVLTSLTLRCSDSWYSSPACSFDLLAPTKSPVSGWRNRRMFQAV